MVQNQEPENSYLKILILFTFNIVQFRHVSVLELNQNSKLARYLKVFLTKD